MIARLCWAESIHKLEQLDVFEDVFIVVLNNNPDFSGPVEQAARQFKVVTGNEVAGRYWLTGIEQNLLFGQVGKQGGFNLSRGQTQAGRSLGQKLLTAGLVEQVKLARNRALLKKPAAQVNRLNRWGAAKSAAVFEHGRQAAQYRIIKAIAFVILQRCGQLPPAVTHVRPKQGRQIVRHLQIVVVSLNGPG